MFGNSNMNDADARFSPKTQGSVISIFSGSKSSPGTSVRGALLAKGPDSSFAEAHRGFNSEPIHIEDAVKGQEDEVEDWRDK